MGHFGKHACRPIDRAQWRPRAAAGAAGARRWGLAACLGLWLLLGACCLLYAASATRCACSLSVPAAVRLGLFVGCQGAGERRAGTGAKVGRSLARALSGYSGQPGGPPALALALRSVRSPGAGWGALCAVCCARRCAIIHQPGSLPAFSVLSIAHSAHSCLARPNGVPTNQPTSRGSGAQTNWFTAHRTPTHPRRRRRKEEESRSNSLTLTRHTVATRAHTTHDTRRTGPR